jgi:chromate transporter
MATEITMNEIAAPAYTLRQLVQYFFKLGYAGFGGPVALVGYMYLDLLKKESGSLRKNTRTVWPLPSLHQDHWRHS